jgi:NADH-quinone oxidoreductase subunit B
VRQGRVDLGMPVLGESEQPAPRPMRYLLDQGRPFALSVLDLGLACCAVEFVAATLTHPDLLVADGTDTGSPARTQVLVVAGTVTDKMAPAVRGIYESMPEPRYVVSFGSCANSGGPYWDSYCVTKGVDQILPVDVYVPGCPPRPEALVQGLRRLQHELDDDQ